MKLQLILGNQLFPLKYYKNSHKNVFMCEDFDLCTHYKYHKHKILFFLSSMRHFRNELRAKNYVVHYTELDKRTDFFTRLETFCRNNKVDEISCFEIEDKFFEQKVHTFCEENNIELVIEETPMFMVSRSKFQEYNDSVKKPLMKTFYEKLRQETGILMDENGTPLGGKYSFDSENRKKIPKKFNVITNKIKNTKDEHTEDVKKLVEEHFNDHPGSCENFWMDVTRTEFVKSFKIFLKERFELFGDYEDAIDLRDPFLYHSVLSPYINIGFITPHEVVELVLDCDVPLNSKEGFIRQVIGWREFMRGIYQVYSEHQENLNFFNHQRKLTQAWYEGTTGIPPLDDAIKKVNEFGYGHHIERLMIISNMMLLCEIDPVKVHAWFMEMYVDSSDWVMGPNVYGMAQFSDGGIFSTKPYISGSNYILKMSHYTKDEWCDVFDGLYWSFIENKKDFLKKNPRMSMMVNMLKKMDDDKKSRIFRAKEKFLMDMTK